MFCGECGQKVAQVVPWITATVMTPPPNLQAPTVRIERLLESIPESITLPPQPPTPVDDDVDRTVLSPRNAPAFTLTGPDGVVHHIRVATVIGRHPARPMHRPGIELLALLDETKSLSKSHAVVEPDGDIFTIEDLGSTNGVVIVGDDGSETDLPTGHRTPIPTGTVLALGDYIVTVGRS